MWKWLRGRREQLESEAFSLPPRDFAMPEGVRAYAVGDIHGRSALLEKMLQTIEADSKKNNGERIVQIFLGDYIDRGPDGKKVIELLMQEPVQGHERVCLRGNHEQTLLDYIEEPRLLRSWMQYGGLSTLMAYGVQMPMEVSEETETIVHAQFCDLFPSEHYNWLQALPDHYELGDYYFAHAGVNPELSLKEQEPGDLLWIRKPFLEYGKFFEKYIVHGHTPQKKPDIQPNRANLDVNEADTDMLACLEIKGKERKLLFAE